MIVTPLKFSLIAFWIFLSVAISTFEVASSRTRYLFLLSSALAKHNSCFYPTEKLDWIMLISVYNPWLNWVNITIPLWHAHEVGIYGGLSIFKSHSSGRKDQDFGAQNPGRWRGFGELLRYFFWEFLDPTVRHRSHLVRTESLTSALTSWRGLEG